MVNNYDSVNNLASLNKEVIEFNLPDDSKKAKCPVLKYDSLQLYFKFINKIIIR